MNVNSAFNWLIVVETLHIAGLFVAASFLEHHAFRDELREFLAGHGEVYASEMTFAFAVLVLALFASSIVSLFGLWRRKRWGAYLFMFSFALGIMSIVTDSNTITVSTSLDWLYDATLGSVAVFQLAFLILKREELGFPPLIGGSSARPG